MRTIKQKIAVTLTLIAVLFSSMAIHPKRAEAIVGMSLGNSVLANIGGLVATLGFAGWLPSGLMFATCANGQDSCSDEGKTIRIAAFASSTAAFVVGLLLLDGPEQMPTFKYSEGLANAAGLSKRQKRALRREIPFLNSALLELAKENRDSPVPTKTELMDIAKPVADQLSKEMKEALAMLIQYNIDQANQPRQR